ncbi:hypothetical protein RND81_01G045900 [Saponaria officinalis]|uniref:Uncharacterized protein n=1 Tax=Saponaria officinalis TaxID=3572 RepID=A0AAW1NE66_SAPOF
MAGDTVKPIGSLGRNFVPLRVRADSDFAIIEVLTMLCSVNKLGGYARRRRVLLTGCLRVNIFRTPFMKSNLGHNPSYTRRSIWEAKKVLLMGVRRRIGDESATNIWTDAWIPENQSGKAISTRPEGCQLERVCELMENDNRSWDVGKDESKTIGTGEVGRMKIAWSARHMGCCVAEGMRGLKRLARGRTHGLGVSFGKLILSYVSNRISGSVARRPFRRRQ